MAESLGADRLLHYSLGGRPVYACIRVGVFGRQDAFELGEGREVEASRLGWDRAGAERARLMTIS